MPRVTAKRSKQRHRARHVSEPAVEMSADRFKLHGGDYCLDVSLPIRVGQVLQKDEPAQAGRARAVAPRMRVHDADFLLAIHEVTNGRSLKEDLL